MPETGKDIRWQQRLGSFKKALSQLRKFVEKGDLSELEEQGAIQAFEYSYELGWLLLKDFLEFQGETEIYGSRDAIKKAFQAGLIQDGEMWMDAYVSRTKTSHTYNEETAKEVVNAILTKYSGLFTALEQKMESLIDRGETTAKADRFGIKTSILSSVTDVFKKHPKVDAVILYGSRAKGAHKPGSDIDLTLKGDDLNLQEINRIALELDDLLLPYTFDISIYHRIDNPDLVKHIQRVGKTIYQRI